MLLEERGLVEVLGCGSGTDLLLLLLLLLIDRVRMDE